MSAWCRGALLAALCVPLVAQTPDAAFFETRIRPVLAAKCYGCHSSTLKAPMGSLVLDTKAGLAKGGATGAIVVPGKPTESKLAKAISYTDPQLHMPPSGKLPDNVIADFSEWIAAGAKDPRSDSGAPASAALKGMSLEDGRKWWAFQPVREVAAPRIRDARWPQNKIDSFILSKLEAQNIKPSETADARTLARRAYVDLAGYKPSYEEVEAFANDKSPNAWAMLVDRLMASPQYGERWARHWMDVARFGEDNPTGEATNPGYPYAWRYRDWMIEAVNKDVPYDRFVKLQLAADLMADAKRDDMRALGYLGAAPIYHKDQRLSADVIGGFLTDDFDERVDAVTRGVLAMTVACARCHDHKFDPIPTKDYYGLVGVFASTMRAERPMFDVDPKVEARYLWVQNRLFDLRYSANLLTNEASTVVGSAERVAKWRAEIDSLKAEMETLREKNPQLIQSLEKFWAAPPQRRPQQAPAATTATTNPPAPTSPFATPLKTIEAPPPPPPPPQQRRGGQSSTEPYMNAVYEAAQYVDGTDPQYTWLVYKPGEARDFPVLPNGNVATPGEIVPRHFLTVLSKGDSRFKNGSGRLELAEKIFTEGAPLAARVIVNRVWGWHFGKPLAATPGDFGVQGEKPTHPELLDDLAARFIANGWSLKWLNREIMMSAAYRQASRPREDARKIDEDNSLVWRMNPRRLDIEAYRDTLLRVSGRLSDKMGGPSEDIDSEASVRRTVYGRVGRGRMSNLLKTFDFPDPMQTSGGRDLTTSPLQQLFVMNSGFMRTASTALVQSVKDEVDHAAKLRALYRKILSRDPSAKELDMGLSYLTEGALEDYAQVLLSTNEEIFWQ